MAVWLTSDTHFGHDNIRRYSNRPFSSVAEMNEYLILNWNKVVQPDDEVYHLGDVFLCNMEMAKAIIKRLNGKKYLVRGNHERTAENLRSEFVWIKEYFRLKVPDSSAPGGRHEIVMLHYAMRVWDKSHYGAFHAYGHSHGTLAEDPASRSMDVGVDSVSQRLGGGPESYRPISYFEFRDWMLAKRWVPIDHHDDNAP